MTIAEILGRAAARVASGHTKRASARDASGCKVNSYSRKAVCWCPAGAIEAEVISEDGYLRPGVPSMAIDKALAVVRVANREWAPSVSRANDRPETTQAEAFWALLEARDYARASEEANPA